MPPFPQAGPVDADVLRKLKTQGLEHPIIDQRLDYMDKAHLLSHYIGPAAGRPAKTKRKEEPWLKPDGRCYPSMLPTQRGGRWSTTDPPLATFPPKYRDIVVPDDDECWVVWDYDAIEARIAAAETDDVEDLEAFAKGWDLHTVTTCRIFRYPLPPNLLSHVVHEGEECREWREKYRWGGKDDRRRHMAKVARYSLLFSLDWRGIYEAKDVEKLGASRGELERLARDYLASKPGLVARRRQVQQDGWRTHSSTTFLGRTRPLMGEREDVMKQAWSHRISGAVSDIMNETLAAIDAHWPESCLAYQSHDSGKIGFPLDVEWWPAIEPFVVKTYTIRGHEVTFTADWHVIPPGGHQHGERCRPHKCHYDTPEQWFEGRHHGA